MDRCGFCSVKLKKSEGINVKELVIDTNARIVKFTDVLFDLFYCEIDVPKICADCMESVNKYYLFKEKLKTVIKMPLPKHVEIIKKVQSFLSKADCQCSVAVHLDIMSIVPESRSHLMTSIKHFNPEIQLTQTTRKPVAVKKEASKPSKAANSSFNSTQPPRSVPYYANDDDDEGATPESNDEDYGKQKSKRKKKKSPRGRPSKKQKLSNGPQFVKEEQRLEGSTTFTEHRPVGYNDILHSTRLTRTLNDEQKSWLTCQLAKTEHNRVEYICAICSKLLNSYHGITYHYIYRHYSKALTNSKLWVSQKVKEGRKTIENSGGMMKQIFQCTECSRSFNNQPGLRYHLTQHLNSYADDDEFCADNSSDQES